MVTGDLISDLPYVSLSSSMVLPYAEEKVLGEFSKIFYNPSSDPEMDNLRILLMQSLNWNVIINKYSEFKQENSGMNSFARFVTGTLDTFKSSSRKKRQVELLQQSNQFLNMTQLEDMMTVLQSLNMTVMEDVVVSLASEMTIVIRNSVVTNYTNYLNIKIQITPVTLSSFSFHELNIFNIFSNINFIWCSIFSQFF